MTQAPPVTFKILKEIIAEQTTLTVINDYDPFILYKRQY
jgi:hypothetical protein